MESNVPVFDGTKFDKAAFKPRKEVLHLLKFSLKCYFYLLKILLVVIITYYCIIFRVFTFPN